MSIAKTLEITAESTEGFDAAIREGITRASKTIHNIKSAWIKDQEIIVSDGEPSKYKVAMKLTFVVEG
jgi:hypothetical protein